MLRLVDKNKYRKKKVYAAYTKANLVKQANFRVSDPGSTRRTTRLKEPIEVAYSDRDIILVYLYIVQYNIRHEKSIKFLFRYRNEKNG